MNEFCAIFEKTLLAGDGWRTLLSGLLVTVEITALSLVLGTLLGAGICALRLSRFRLVRWFGAAYIAILRGSPVLLLLMLMYYVIFARSDLPAPMIAVSAFSLNVAAHVAEVMRAALMATDPMQVEAARTLGFSRFQAFMIVTLPQTARIARPVYLSTVINLLQWTSVVGYVTITDLTRAVNNIGSRTMSPLFMILVGMVLYLTLACCCYGAGILYDKISQRSRS